MNFREVQTKAAASAAVIITSRTPIPSGTTTAGAANESRTDNLSCGPDIFKEGQLQGNRSYGCRISL